MNNSRLLILSFFLSASLATQAQIVDDLEDDLFEEEEELTDTLDTSMDFPESMTDNIDSLMNLYVTKTYLEPDADCNMQDVNPEYTREQYVDRLQRMPTVMEMTYNEEVRACIDRYTARLRRSVSYMLGAVNFYNIFGGDCFIGNFTTRMNRNFTNTEAPNNNIIIDGTLWGKYYHNNEMATGENNKRIIPGDVYAV